MFRLPHCASQGNVPAAIDPAQVPYLVRSYAISYVPSASVLGILRRQHTAPSAEKMFLAYGDPSVGRSVENAVRGPTRPTAEIRAPRIQPGGSEAKRAPVSAALEILLGDRASEQASRAGAGALPDHSVCRPRGAE